MSASAESLTTFLIEEQLSDSYREQVNNFFLPFINVLKPRIAAGRLRVLGIHGAQGSGKSTLASFLRWYLGERSGLRVAQLSLDDFYLRRGERQELAQRVHPLLATRGVPGTHDVKLALRTLHRLQGLQPGESMALPRFDKASDDRFDEGDWPQIAGPVDLIIFEGWCLGAGPQSDAALLSPVNVLEANDDADGDWRRYVNQQLAGDYQRLFAEVDYLLMLQAPSFDCVAGWRQQQERHLASRRSGAQIMSEADIVRFVQHYERLTRHCLATLPARADCVMTMAEDRSIQKVDCQEGELRHD